MAIKEDSINEKKLAKKVSNVSREDLVAAYWKVVGHAKPEDMEEFNRKNPTKEEVFDAMLMSDRVPYRNKLEAAFNPKYKDLGKYSLAIDAVLKEKAEAKKRAKEQAEFEEGQRRYRERREKIVENNEKIEEEERQKRLRTARPLKVLRKVQASKMSRGVVPRQREM